MIPLRAAVNADLADGTEGLDAVVHWLVVGYQGIGGNHHQAVAGAKVGGEEISHGPLLAPPQVLPNHPWRSWS